MLHHAVTANIFFVHCTGHFPWMFTLMKLAFGHSEPGKAVAYIRKVALDLVKTRRQNGHSADKVHTTYRRITVCLHACKQVTRTKAKNDAMGKYQRMFAV